ncbi:hypothetical protein D3C73_1579430 [compost metagenome]
MERTEWALPLVQSGLRFGFLIRKRRMQLYWTAVNGCLRQKMLKVIFIPSLLQM